MPARDDPPPSGPEPLPMNIPGQAWLVRAVMQARFHVDDDEAMRQLGSFVRAGGIIEQVGAVVTWLAVAIAIVAAIPVGGGIGTRFGMIAGILAMMGATVVFGGVTIIVCALLQQVAWGVLVRRLDARMEALGWNGPGTRVVDGDDGDDADRDVHGDGEDGDGAARA